MKRYALFSNYSTEYVHQDQSLSTKTTYDDDDVFVYVNNTILI